MKNNNHIQSGFINEQKIEQAQSNRKCRNRDCFLPVKKGDKVIRVSDGLLCYRCSKIGIEASIKRTEEGLKEKQQMQSQIAEAQPSASIPEIKTAFQLYEEQRGENGTTAS